MTLAISFFEAIFWRGWVLVRLEGVKVRPNDKVSTLPG